MNDVKLTCLTIDVWKAACGEVMEEKDFAACASQKGATGTTVQLYKYWYLFSFDTEICMLPAAVSEVT